MTSDGATLTRTLDASTTFRPAKLAHVVLRTAHFDEAIDWYQTVLGAFTVFRSDALAFLTYDEEHHRIALAAEDPDGNEIELQVDNFADLQGLLGWASSGAFAINPIGTLFDPEDLARRLEAGAPEADLLHPLGPDQMQPPALERLPAHVVAALEQTPPA